MRVIANAEGAEVLLTLLRQPGMSEQQFVADAEWVRRDLNALKGLLEGVAAGQGRFANPCDADKRLNAVETGGA